MVKAGMLKATQKANPELGEKTIKSVFEKAGWNGIANEYLEERLGDVVKGALYEVGLSDQEFEIPTLQQSVEEILAFAIMGTGIKAVTKGNIGLSIEDVSRDDTITQIKKAQEEGKSFEEFVEKVNNFTELEKKAIK